MRLYQGDVTRKTTKLELIKCCCWVFFCFCFFPRLRRSTWKNLYQNAAVLRVDLLKDHQLYRLQDCQYVCALFIPDILQAGAVKELIPFLILSSGDPATRVGAICVWIQQPVSKRTCTMPSLSTRMSQNSCAVTSISLYCLAPSAMCCDHASTNHGDFVDYYAPLKNK